MDKQDRFLGENLKRIRKDLGLKQYEITGGEITRNLISLIENNKTPLYEHIAKIISENVNRLCKERNIDTYIDIQDILDFKRYEAKQTIDKYIASLKNGSFNDDTDLKNHIREIEQFLSEWDIPEKKSVIYEVIGDIFYSRNDFYTSHTYYVKALENTKGHDNVHQLCSIVLKISRCLIELNRYEEIVDYSKIITLYSNEISNDLLLKLLFNQSLAFKNLKLFDRAINILNDIEILINKNDIEKYSDILILKANCLRDKKQFNDSLEIYNGVSDILDDDYTEKKILVYLNMIEIYWKLNNKEMINDCIQIILNLFDENNKTSIYEPDIYLKTAIGYKHLNNMTLAERHLIKSKNSAQEINKIKIQIEAITCLLDLYAYLNETNKIDILAEEIINLISNNLLSPGDTLIFKLISYYNEIGAAKKIKEFINIILNLQR